MKIKMLSLIWNDRTLVSYNGFKNMNSPYYVYTWKDFYDKLEIFLNDGKEPYVRSLTNKCHNYHLPKPYEHRNFHLSDGLGLRKLSRRLWHRFGDKVIVVRDNDKVKIKLNPKSAILLRQI